MPSLGRLHRLSSHIAAAGAAARSHRAAGEECRAGFAHSASRSGADPRTTTLRPELPAHRPPSACAHRLASAAWLVTSRARRSSHARHARLARPGPRPDGSALPPLARFWVGDRRAFPGLRVLSRRRRTPPRRTTERPDDRRGGWADLSGADVKQIAWSVRDFYSHNRATTTADGWTPFGRPWRALMT